MRHYYTVKSHVEEGIFELINSFYNETRHASLDEINYEKPEDLIGKKISVSYFKPYIEIGVGARIEPDYY